MSKFLWVLKHLFPFTNLKNFVIRKPKLHKNINKTPLRSEFLLGYYSQTMGWRVKGGGLKKLVQVIDFELQLIICNQDSL